MTKNVYRMTGLAAVALAGLGLIVGLAGCCSMVKSCLQQVLILGQPQSDVVFTNADATFSVYAVAGPPLTNSGLTYQWQVNTYLLDPMNPNANWTNCTGPGATSSTITITNVQLSDVGYYRVLVSASGNTVTSDAPYLQVITGGSINVYGTPIAGSGGGNYCSGGPFAGYIPYTNCPKCGSWGWTYADPSLVITATDTLNPNISKVGYYGCYGDAGCGNNGTVTKQPPFTLPTGSPRYQFTLYFSGGVPTSPRPYPLTLSNLH